MQTLGCSYISQVFFFEGNPNGVSEWRKTGVGISAM